MFELKGTCKDLHVPWIWLVYQAITHDANYAVQNPHLTQVTLFGAEATLQFYFEGLAHSLFIFGQAFVCSKSREVIAVYHHRDLPARAVEATRRRVPRDEAHGRQRVGVAALPNRASVPGALHALIEPRDCPVSLAHFCREANK